MPAPNVSDRSLLDLFSLKGRVALVTGGARGIGEAICRRLQEAGAAVALADIDLQAAQATAAALAASGGRVEAFAIDVTDRASVDSCFQAVNASFGQVNILVNNAGILSFPSSFIDVDPEVWERTMAVNVTGVLNCSRVFARRLIDAGEGGVIFNLASTASFRVPNPGTIVYTTSKHAVHAVTKTMALELGPHGIRVLDVAPAVVETPGLAALREFSAARAAADPSAVRLGAKEALAALPLGRGNDPDDVARVVVFAVSDLAVMMTGSTLVVDAGSMIR
jgi:NAD(P)-dependent dehydrogenase (short-subunit alcohol dehydrogenase family)